MNNETCGCGSEEKTSSAKGIVRINYKEDFELVVELLAGDNPYTLGDEDFSIDFIVMASRYTVGRTAGVCERCAVDGNKIRCFMDGHGLPPGELRAEVKVNTPDPNYADGKRLSVAIAEGVVLLVKDNTRFDGAVIKANIPVVMVDAYQLAKEHGYKGTIDEYYATFTEIGHLKEKIKSTMDAIVAAVNGATTATTQANEAAKQAREAAENVKDGESGIPRQALHGTADTTFSLRPNIMEVWGVVAELNLSLAPAIDAEFVTEYLFEFTCPSDKWTSLSLPAELKWYNEYVVVPEAGKTYQASIVNHVIVMGRA